MMKEKKIPLKNYIIYGIIVVVTLVGVFYLNEWYKAYKKLELENSYISKYITELNYDEFENYILENPNTIIYIGKTNSEASINVEKKLHKLLDSNELIDISIFLNLTNNENVLTSIQNKYYNSKSLPNLDRIPAIVIFDNMKIVDVLVSDEEENISRGDIIDLLEGFEKLK